MYAIVEISGQQFKVEKNQQIFVNRLQEKEGAKITLENVMLLDDKGKITVGTPIISEARVTAKVIDHVKGEKKIIFKKKRRKGYRVKNGHRQYLSEIQISSISSSGSKSSKKVDDSKSISKTESKIKAKPKKVSKNSIASKQDFSSKSVSELKNLAKEKGLTGVSKMKKADLIKALK